MNEDSSRSRTGLTPRQVAIGALFLALTYLALAADDVTAGALTREDAWVESLGAAAFLAAGVLFVRAFRRSRESTWLVRAFLIAVAVFCVVAAGEEISWGQRILGIATPAELAAVNKQDETNLHNIEGLPFSTYQLVVVFWFSFTILVPLAARLHRPAARLLERALPIVPLSLGALFLFNDALSKLAPRLVAATSDHLSPYVLQHAPVEIKEANLALLCALTALWISDVLLAPRRQARAAAGEAQR